MDPVFSLPYSEYVVANELAALFPSKDGCSIFVPASRQEKGIDLLLVRREEDQTWIVPIQVKSSRYYFNDEPKRSGTHRHKYGLWYPRPTVHNAAKLWMLTGIYAPETDRLGKSAPNWWRPMILCFTAEELRGLVEGARTKGGKEDSIGFAFSTSNEIFLTRGRQGPEPQDYSDFLIERCRDKIARTLGM